MLKTVEKYIADKHLLTPNARVIVGISGGMDSIVLLSMLASIGYQCIAAHCNFHLRGKESERDADFVKKWSKGIAIEYTSIDFNTQEYARKKKISIEMAARELRYAWFETIRKKYDAEAIAVAHHRDDSVETVLLNLIRGTGIKGLTGISEKNDHLIRPLLCLSRNDIQNYIKEKDLPYVNDSSNSDESFVRNAIRLTIIPKLEKINPSVKETINRTSENLSEVELIYNSYIENAKKAVFNNNKIDIDRLKNTLSPSSVLFEILSPLGFNSSVITDILSVFDATSGKIFYSDKYRLIKDRSYFLLDKIQKDQQNEKKEYLIDKKTQEIIAPIHLKISIQSADTTIYKNPIFLYADADKLTFPLILRKWRSGDWFIPFGMKGKKKLSDYFTDLKLNLVEKENLWIVESGKDVVWIVGMRSDDRFKVTNTTQNIVIMQFVTNSEN